VWRRGVAAALDGPFLQGAFRQEQGDFFETLPEFKGFFRRSAPRTDQELGLVLKQDFQILADRVLFIKGAGGRGRSGRFIDVLHSLSPCVSVVVRLHGLTELLSTTVSK